MEKLTVCYLVGAVVGAAAMIGFVLLFPDRFDAIPAGVLSAVLGLLTLWALSDSDRSDSAVGVRGD